jgi:hypothetical protein
MLASLLFGSYRRRVLGLLLLHPQESFHVREIARQTETNAGTLHKELARLAQAGLLQRERVGNQLRYGANRQCPIFAEMASILRKTSGLADVLLDAISPLARRIKVALIFGSVARGKSERVVMWMFCLSAKSALPKLSRRCTQHKKNRPRNKPGGHVAGRIPAQNSGRGWFPARRARQGQALPDGGRE